MPVRIKPLTKAQLIGYFRDYREAFPEWSVEHDVTLSRSLGAIKQVIAFEALRSGAYRPSHGIKVAGPPDGGQLLFRYLDVRHREVLPREHEKNYPTVIKAMEEQFRPAVRDPLDLAKVLQLGEEEIVRDGVENPVTFSSLAVLSAHLGNLDQSLRWCDRSGSRLANIDRELADWELRLVSFNQRLQQAIRSDHVNKFLHGKTDPHLH